MSGFWLDDQPQKTWTLQDIYDDLGTLNDVAAAIDVNHYRMASWITRRERIKCPQPIRKIANANIYSIQEWRDWFHKWSTDPRRVEWQANSKTNASGKPFFEQHGPARRDFHPERSKKKPTPEE